MPNFRLMQLQCTKVQCVLHLLVACCHQTRRMILYFSAAASITDNLVFPVAVAATGCSLPPGRRLCRDCSSSLQYAGWYRWYWSSSLSSGRHKKWRQRLRRSSGFPDACIPWVTVDRSSFWKRIRDATPAVRRRHAVFGEAHLAQRLGT